MTFQHITGLTVRLYEPAVTGQDPFGGDICELIPTDIANVLVSPAQQGGQEVLEAAALQGKKAVYMLAIPKEDGHDWKDKTVEFFGERFRVIGYPTQGIDHLIPGPWNRKVLVERCE